jgi:hypothetical protein
MDDDAGLRAVIDALGAALPSAAEQEAVLDLTRVVAHGSQRRFGPISVYALALALDPSSPSADRVAVLRRAIDAFEPGPQG